MHVFVETNWLVDVVAPAHHQKRTAVRLLERAKAGELTLHVPTICFTEARVVVNRGKFSPRTEANALRHYVRWARDEGKTTSEDANVVFRVVDQFESRLSTEVGAVDSRLQDVMDSPGLRAFALSEAMLSASRDLALRDPALESFDQAILAAILVRSGEVMAEHTVDRCFFCEKDHHLLPWDRNGDPRPTLRAMYDLHRVWVYDDWEMTEGPWDGWPEEPPPRSR